MFAGKWSNSGPIFGKNYKRCRQKRSRSKSHMCSSTMSNNSTCQWRVRYSHIDKHICILRFRFRDNNEIVNDERKKQEEALHKFRTREANLLIAQAETEAVSEKSFDIPRCNLVLRFDPPSTYIKYDNGKRLLSQSPDSLHGILVDKRDKLMFALPASTLEKKRLKYENKANRQYLIPEILDIHPHRYGGKQFVFHQFYIELIVFCQQRIYEDA